MTRLMSCSMSMMAMWKVSRMRRMFSMSSWVSEGFMPAAGSSRSRIRGLEARARDDLQPALGAVGQAPGGRLGEIRQTEEVEKLQGGLRGLALCLAVAEAVGDGGQEVLLHHIVHAPP